MTTYSIVDESGETRLRGTIEPAPGGSGPGLVATVPVSSAELRALAGSPKTLITGTPGFVIVPTAWVIAYFAGATPYTTPNGSVFSFYIGGLHLATNFVMPDFLDQAADQSLTQGYDNGLSNDPLAAQDGGSLTLNNDGADPTLGDGTVKVTVYYFLGPLT